MYRLAYRHFGDGHESLVVNHSTSSPAAIRWYEIQNPAGTPALFQQGTYSPDASSRWMGSVAMDAGGNIAAAYSVSSSSMLPGIRYAGRLLSDPLGTLGAETTLVQGAGAEVGTYRWGDYSSLSLDPSDDCTFWYTNEYFKTNGTSWSTRIGSFKFPSCGTAQSVTFSKMDLLFAGQPLNHASSSQSVTLRNQQSAALNVSSVAVSGDY